MAHRYTAQIIHLENEKLFTRRATLMKREMSTIDENSSTERKKISSMNSVFRFREKWKSV